MNHSHGIIWETCGRQTEFSVSKRPSENFKCLKLKLNDTFSPHTFCFQTANGTKYLQCTFTRHGLVLHVFPRNLKTLKDCFRPEVFLNYCHQNRERYRRKAEGASGASIVEKHLEKLFVKQTNSHPHFFSSPPFSI